MCPPLHQQHALVSSHGVQRLKLELLSDPLVLMILRLFRHCYDSELVLLRWFRHGARYVRCAEP